MLSSGTPPGSRTQVTSGTLPGSRTQDTSGTPPGSRTQDTSEGNNSLHTLYVTRGMRTDLAVGGHQADWKRLSAMSVVDRRSVIMGHLIMFCTLHCIGA